MLGFRHEHAKDSPASFVLCPDESEITVATLLELGLQRLRHWLILPKSQRAGGSRR